MGELWRGLAAHLTDRSGLTLLLAVVLLLGARSVNELWFERRVAALTVEDARLPDVRQIDESVRLPFIEAYLDHRRQADRRPTVVAVGDSQFFGFGVHARETFSRPLAAMLGDDRGLVNLSVVDARLRDVESVLQAVSASGLDVATVIWGLGLHHLGTAYRDGPRRVPPPPRFRFIAVTALDIDPLRGVSAPDAPFWVNPRLEPDLYDHIRVTEPDLDGVFARLASLGAQVLVTVPPVCLEEFPRYGYDPGPFHAGLRALSARVTGEGFEFVDLMSRFTKADFLDFMHLRPHGHAKLAHLLAAHLP